ncbi:MULTISPECIES: hypothetical protein [unclassified Streptomyces]|nr:MULTISPECIES: hypothetical protein [unclassified Streptomyces]MEE1764697.1 hypothetical protein [Streptomyces sp. SP18BB07]MEE1835521.1 hypothetical protein [Streptomyces sp. SP17KL33]
MVSAYVLNATVPRRYGMDDEPSARAGNAQAGWTRLDGWGGDPLGASAGM